jgi:hypothetical protein
MTLLIVLFCIAVYFIICICGWMAYCSKVEMDYEFDEGDIFLN